MATPPPEPPTRFPRHKFNADEVETLNALLQRIAANDAGAEREFLEEIEPWITRNINRLSATRPWQDPGLIHDAVMDAVQSRITFVRNGGDETTTKWENFRNLSYIHAVKKIKQLAKEAQRRGLSFGHISEVGEEPSHTPNPTEAMEYAELHADLQDAVESLESKQQRDYLTGIYLEGKTPAQVSAEHGKAIRHVHTVVNRGRDTIRQNLPWISNSLQQHADGEQPVVMHRESNAAVQDAAHSTRAEPGTHMIKHLEALQKELRESLALHLEMKAGPARVDENLGRRFFVYSGVTRYVAQATDVPEAKVERFLYKPFYYDLDDCREMLGKESIGRLLGALPKQEKREEVAQPLQAFADAAFAYHKGQDFVQSPAR